MIEEGLASRIKDNDQEEDDSNPTEILHLTRNFIVTALFASCLVAFSIGRIARVQLLNLASTDVSKLDMAYFDPGFVSLPGPVLSLPDPVMKPGKGIPRTTYTSKNFDTASATTHSRWVVTQKGDEQCASLPGQPACTQTHAFTAPSNEPFLMEENSLDEEHLPSGQHLLVDIENVDPVFLNSEERLASAMLELVDKCGLTLLSYHCHQLKPSGVSCAGVLLESHVSFHTWPSNGVITLDLYTCGPNSLLPVVPVVEKLFAIVSSSFSIREQAPKMIWAHKYRGFGAHTDCAEITDMFHFPLGQMSDFKKEVVSATTKYQRMDVYDVLRPGVQNIELYKRSLQNDDSYESTHPDLFAPDRIVFLDGILQSRRSGDAAYHESLVHPAMFAHKNPKRVAIVGGGEGATLREVLKHNTVEKVVMIDIDEQMVQLSRAFLPFWSDCSTIINSTSSCFSDPRVETYHEDAFQWFTDKFSPYGWNSSIQFSPYSKEEPFDVIIMDALDPQVQKEFANVLYEGGAPIFSQGLHESGILVAQVGEACTIDSPSDEFSVDKNRLKFIKMLVEVGFKSVRDYEESHNGFERPWEFIIAFKDYSSKADWFASSAEIDLKIMKRGMRTKNGESPLLFFDGATMASYRYPSKGSEVSFCRHAPNETDCVNGQGFDPEMINLPLSSLEVKQSSLGKKAGRGVFAKTNIPHKSYVGLDKLVPHIHMGTSTVNLIAAWGTKTPWVYEYYGGEELQIYTQGYGHYFSPHGDIEVRVDSTFHCFINHGCNGTNNVGHDLLVTEANADPWSIPAELASRYVGEEAAYNPAKERQVHFYSSAIPLRYIEKGEELFDNYLGMSGMDLKSWTEDVLGLKSQCLGGVGDITMYDTWEIKDL